MQENTTAIKYYDIGLNLFCRQFPDPEKVIQDAMDHGICCILTGTDPKENQKIDHFVKTHCAYGTAGIHPHNADRASQQDFAMRLRMITLWQSVSADLIMTECFRPRRTRFGVWRSILCLRRN